MLTMLTSLIRGLTCQHVYQFSRSRPGTLVCKKCQGRKRAA